jgi:hypothetical protein
MLKYKPLIEKIKKDPSRASFTPSELTLIKEALETIQFLEIFLKYREDYLEEITKCIT